LGYDLQISSVNKTEPNMHKKNKQSEEDYATREKWLIEPGILVPPKRKRSWPVSLPRPVGNVSDEVMEQIWRENESAGMSELAGKGRIMIAIAISNAH